MSVLSRLTVRASYNILTPIVLLSLVAPVPALAANFDWVITAPRLELVLDENDSLTNRSTIVSDGNAAVFSNYDLRFISNEAGATINGGTGAAVGIFGNVGSINNAGDIISAEDSGLVVNGNVTRFINSGKILADEAGVYISGNATSFENTGSIRSDAATIIAVSLGEAGTVINSGTIRSLADDGLSGYRALHIGAGGVDTIINSGTIEGYLTGIIVVGDAGTITNSKLIRSVTGDAIHVTGELEKLVNTGTLSGSLGVYVGKDAGSVFNSGLIKSSEYEALLFNQDVESITNAGTIESDGEGIQVNGNAGTITNSGKITSADSTGVYVVGDAAKFINTGTIEGGREGVEINGEVVSFFNSGTIRSSGSDAIYISKKVSDFHNTGIIEGTTGVSFATGGSYLKNSGTIEGTDGKAVVLSGDNNTLAIGTGARFIGEVDFNGGDNSFLDATNFHGSTIILVEELDAGNVRAGQNYYYQTPQLVYILGGGFINQASQPVTNLVTGLGELATSKLALGDSITDADFVSSYYPTNRSAAENAVADATAGGYGTTYWADAIGGAGRNSGAEASDIYGALIAGAHTQLSDDIKLGVLGGFAHATLDVGNGSQTVKSTIGVVGAYGSYDLGGIQTDFSLIGGLSGNDSAREIIDGDITETATAAYGGWFIAPTVGAYMPVLTTETGEVSVGGRLGYLAGGFNGYTEAGSEAGVTVGAQTYGVLTALVELRGENAVSDTVTINGSLGVFAQNQHGNVVDVSLPGDIDLIGPDGVGGTNFGVKAGIGAEMVISDAFTVNAGLTGNWRSSGTVAASANLGINGKF